MGCACCSGKSNHDNNDKSLQYRDPSQPGPVIATQEQKNINSNDLQGQLFGFPVSFNVFGLNAFIDHIKANIKIENVEFTEQGLNTKTPEFLAMNPHHTIPTFRATNGWSLWESTAIIKHIARLNNKEEFLGHISISMMAAPPPLPQK